MPANLRLELGMNYVKEYNEHAIERESSTPILERFEPLTADEEFFLRLQKINLVEIDKRWVAERYQEGTLFVDDLRNPKQLSLLKEREPVSQHELAHAIVARSLGWTVTSISVVPDGNTLGVTHMIPGGMKTTKEVLSDFITIALASYVGEKMCGNHDHRGCGSDLAKAKYIAEIYSHHFGGGSPNKILSDSFSTASRLLGGSYSEIHKNSMNLSRSGKM